MQFMIDKIQKSIESNVDKRPLVIAIGSFLVFFIICVILGALIIIPNAFSFKEWFNVMKTGPLGDSFNGIIGPFIAFLVAILTFLAFYIQYKANEIQNSLNVKIQFENRFFDLVKIHIDNVHEMTYTKFAKSNYEQIESRKVFRIISQEFIECLHEIKKIAKTYDQIEIIKPEYYEKLASIIKENRCKVSPTELALIDIAYCTVFFGIAKESEQVFLTLFWNRYNTEFIDQIRKFLQLKPKITSENMIEYSRWDAFKKMPKEVLRGLFDEIYTHRIANDELSPIAKDLILNYHLEKYYDGHQHLLGHYFRHLFQSFKFLSYQEQFSDKEKYFYGKTLRAQLSTYEQFLLFINSLSSLGMKWEYTSEVVKKNVDNMIIEEKMKLITNYNLIKNLPGSQYYDFQYRKFYPAVNFEYRDDISYK
jgi:hypothetical protein